MARSPLLHRAPAPAALALTLAFLAAPAPRAHADEGMWTLDNLPLAQLEQRYHFKPTAAWLENLQKSAVNFGGASGAFVSPDGLVLTNQHVGRGQLQKLSTPAHNLVELGFYAHGRAEELPCPDLEVKVLESMESVTARVHAAVDSTAEPPRQAAQRREAIAKIEQEGTRDGLKGEVVELYHGGQYWLHRYKIYHDVRMVCAPEEQAAFYGGDLDNFSYPRCDLDFTFFRVYENGQPIHNAHWIHWSRTGAKENDLVFVIGHPGRTGRQKTISQLEFERDHDLPLRNAMYEQRLAAYRKWAARGPEQARQVGDRIRGLENNLKRQRGFLALLRDPEFLGRKRAEEEALRARVEQNPALEASAGGAWDAIARAEAERATRARELLLADMTRVNRMVDMATGILRYTTEVEKPNGARLREYRDANLPSEKLQLLSPAPLYPEMEEMILAQTLQIARDSLGADDAFVKAALDGRTPAAVAHAAFAGTHLAGVAERQRLLEGGAKAVAASTDPLLAFAKRVDAPYRELRSWREDKLESVESAQGARIARARFALNGTHEYPDATGTLRLSYGRVAGYEQFTTEVPWKTTWFDLYGRAASFDDRYPFTLTPRERAAEKRVDMATPLDFVSTDDIIGGNSGSPVVDRNGEYVGLVFDGNIQSFIWDYAYSDTQARCVSVDSRALLQALRVVYGMSDLADELTGPAKSAAGDAGR